MAVDLLEDDLLSRCIIYDRAFTGNIHVDDRLWPFEGGSGSDGAYHESGVLRRLAPDDADVHRVGCKIAAVQNERKGEPVPGPTRRYYCGFRTAKIGEISLTDDGYHIVITNIEEHEEESHLDIALFITVEGRSARSTRRTNASLALAEAFGSAVPFVCDCDSDDEHHPLIKFGMDCLDGGDATDQQVEAR